MNKLTSKRFVEGNRAGAQCSLLARPRKSLSKELRKNGQRGKYYLEFKEEVHGQGDVPKGYRYFKVTLSPISMAFFP